MDSWNDLEDMGQSNLDAVTTKSLLAGEMASDDAPPGFGRIAALIVTEKGPASAEELSAEPADVWACAAKAQDF